MVVIGLASDESPIATTHFAVQYQHAPSWSGLAEVGKPCTASMPVASDKRMHLVLVHLAAQRGSTCRRRGLAERLSTLYDHHCVVLFIGVLPVLYVCSRPAKLA